MNWEYRVLRFAKKKSATGWLDTDLLSDRLNSHGEQGWELVSLEAITSIFGREIAAIAVLKRTKE